jgi:hypothetical protein
MSLEGEKRSVQTEPKAKIDLTLRWVHRVLILSNVVADDSVYSGHGCWVLRIMKGSGEGCLFFSTVPFEGGECKREKVKNNPLSVVV